MTATKRALCTKCLRPQRTCICHWITPTEPEVELLFLQHPLEINNAKGSVRLLHLSLQSSHLVTGEVFPEDELHALLYAPFPRQDDKAHSKIIQPLLLYPSTAEDDKCAIPPVWTKITNAANIQYRLVVLDGTWRKSRKMLYLNPLLQELPRLSLSDLPASHYRIRKAHKPDQLSSYEASCYALMQLEGKQDKYLLLLDAFDGFVEQLSSYNPNLEKMKI